MMEIEPIDTNALDIEPERVVKFLISRDWKSTEIDNPEDGSKVLVFYSPDNKGFLLPPKHYSDYEDRLLEVLRHYQHLICPRIHQICTQIKEISIPLTQE